MIMARKMQRGRGGVEYEDIRVGTGEEVATREHEAVISCRITLRRGDWFDEWARAWIDLGDRESLIPGLLHGIEGMRIGGIRRIIVPPHLGGFGFLRPMGVPIVEFRFSQANPKRLDARYKIQPNSMLICEVSLLELKVCRPIRPKLKLARERKAAGIQVKPPKQSKKKGRAG